VSGRVLRRRQIVPGALETVFAFFESPRNLEAITPPWLRFEVVHASDETMRLGTEIEYRLRWQRMPMRWLSRLFAHARIVRAQLEAILDALREAIAARFAERRAEVAPLGAAPPAGSRAT